MAANSISVTNTRGPWDCVEHSWSDTGIYDADGRCIAILSIESDATEETQDSLEIEMRAKGRLIAAAPDLLAALKALTAEFVSVYPIYYYAEPWAHDRNVPLKLAQELIARAEGVSK